MAFSRACRCFLLVSLALLPLGMADWLNGKYCAGSSYMGSNTMATINSVLADLVAKGSSAGFATSSASKGNNVIYGLVQCRGDSASNCASCLADAAKQLPTACSYQADARIWYDNCFMRYDSTNFVGQSDTGVNVVLVNGYTSANESFKEAVGKVVTKAMLNAAAMWFGTATDQYTPSVTIYSLAQCTRDLAPMTCAQCLSAAVSNFYQYCGAGAQFGCHINYSSCRVRYETYPFFNNGGGGRATTDMTKYTKIVVHP